MEQAIIKAVEGGWKHEYISQRFPNGLSDLRAPYSVIEATFYRKDGSVGTKYWWLASKYEALLDPLFWQALGKALGWGITKYKKSVNPRSNSFDRYTITVTRKNTKNNWEAHWHDFIHHLASGKDADSFFKGLLNN